MSLTTDSFTNTIAKTEGYSAGIYLPEDYNTVSKQTWPLILFLHSIGERGNELYLVKKHGPFRYIEDGFKLPFIVIAPQCPDNLWWDTATLNTLLDHIEEHYRVDTSRIYLTGYSMGGSGTWSLANEYSKRFAAIAPVAAFFTPCAPERFKGLPILCIHGAMDTIVPISDSLRMISWIREHGGAVELLVDTDANHTAVTNIYRKPDLYEWFLKHRNNYTK